MAGHSHWAGIKHKKALIDAKKGKLWGKLSKAIIVAARLGGGDPEMNARLRLAVDAAKAVGMPKENIVRAIKRGTGELEGGAAEEALYEGYGPGGVAILCDVVTDNRNRTTSEIRKVFELSDGRLGSSGCVAWMFEKKGLFLIPAEKADEDRLMEIALEVGADDVRRSGDKFEVLCSPERYQAVADALAQAGIQPELSELTRVPKSTVDVSDPETARKILKLMNRLDDHDDVQNVSSNFNIAEEIMAQVGAE
ncbi:MAG: YebC/PmpR family DNA-binding transcriptional regulator [Thermoguttaceae bacterium]